MFSEHNKEEEMLAEFAKYKPYLTTEITCDFCRIKFYSTFDQSASYRYLRHNCKVQARLSEFC